VLIINLFRSAFDNNHETITLDKSVAIIEALPDLDYENAIIYVNGEEKDHAYILQNKDVCTIRQFPKGGAGKIVDVVAGFTAEALLPGIGGIAYGVATGIHYAQTGQTLGDAAINALDSYFRTHTPEPNTSTADTLQNVPQLRGAKNQSNKNKPIPLVLGKHFYTPMYIGMPYTEIGGKDGEDQYFTALFLLGWGKLKVSDIKLGPVSGLAQNIGELTDGSWSWNNNPSFFGDDFIDPSFKDSNPQLELRQGAMEVDLYPQKVVEERLSIELINIGNVKFVDGKPKIQSEKRLEPVRFSAKNPQKVQVEITFIQGLISYDSSGDKQDASVEMCVEWRANPNVDAWYEFGRFGTNEGLSPTQYNSTSRTTTITRKEAKVKRFIAERSFTYVEVNNAPDHVIEIRVIRTSPKMVDDNRTADTVYLSAIRTWCFDNDTDVQASGMKLPQAPIIQKYRDKTARLGFRIKATDKLQGTIDALNCIIQSYARTWDGSNWSTTEMPTNNPASIALKMLQSPALGSNAYPDSMLDLDSFGDFYKWCDERGYSCNGVLISEKKVDDLLGAVLSTGRGMRILNGNRYAVLIDKPRENPVMILNSQNVLEAKNQKKFEDLPDGFSIKFINEIDGYQETEVFVMADGSVTPGPESRIESVEIPFVTDYKQIVKNGRYMLACRQLRPEIWFRKLSVDGYLIGIGDKVEIQDDTIVVGLGEGGVIKSLEIKENVITKIYTDGNFEVADMTKTYGLKIMQADGVNPIKIRTVPVEIPEPGIYNNFTVGIPLTDTVVPHEGDIVAFGIFDKITTDAICFGKKGNGDGTFDMVFLPYQEGIYTTDDSGKIPPYNANITTPQQLPPLHEIPPGQITMDDVINIIGGEFIYRLLPSTDIIKKFANGTISPNKVSCDQFYINLAGVPAKSNLTLRYKTNLSSTEYEYTGPIDVDHDWEYITFLLYNAGVLLDKEEIPVLPDNANVITLDINPDIETIACYFSGRPKKSRIPTDMKAKLYMGTIEMNKEYYTKLVWQILMRQIMEKIQENWDAQISRKVSFLEQIILFPGTGGAIFNPLPDGYPVSRPAVFTDQIILFPGAGGNILCPMNGGYPVKLPGYTEPQPYSLVYELENAPDGVTINRNSGIIEISPDAVFERPYMVITAKAIFLGNVYSKQFTLINLRDSDPGKLSPKYLGKTDTVAYNNIVKILFTDTYSGYVVAKEGDYILYVGENLPGESYWKKNYDLMWNGDTWVQYD